MVLKWLQLKKNHITDNKKKTRNISHSSEYGAFFYSDLYQLANNLYDKMDSHRNTTFTQLPKINSKSTTIHKIGQWIANKCVRYARADIYNIGDVGFNDFFQSPQYAHHTHFYILEQSRMWEYVFHLYGQKGEQKAVTVDDKVRVAGIIFWEDMHPFIQDMTGKSRASTVRAVLDAASGRKLFVMCNQ